LYYIPTRLLNAFTLGNRRSAFIAVTDGLLRTMERRELAGVLAHELSHVRNSDTWVMGLADVVSRLTALLSQFGLLLILFGLPILWLQGLSIPLLPLLILMLAPSINALLQLALSRTREYEADLSAAEITGDPRGLAAALDKLERYQGGWLERIFMPGRREPDPAVLRTHPPTSERIRRLLELIPRYGDDYQHPPGLPRWAEWPDVSRSPRWHLTGLWH
jgi:heat shock protein HtpX